MIAPAGTYAVVSTAEGQAANSNYVVQGAPFIQEATLKDGGGALWQATYSVGDIAAAHGGVQKLGPGMSIVYDGTTNDASLMSMQRSPVVQP